MEQQHGPTADHYQKVINRLSAQLGAMTVEKASMAEMLIEKDREIMNLKSEIADMKEKQADQDSAEPEPVLID